MGGGVLYVPYTEWWIPSSPAFPNGEKRDYPLVPVALSYQGTATAFEFYALIDSGADHCAFPSVFGQKVGLPVESGKKAQTVGSTGTGDTYYHNVRVGFKVQDEPYGFDCYAGFMPDLNKMGVGLLGRNGFFDLFESVSFNSSKRLITLTLKT